MRSTATSENASSYGPPWSVPSKILWVGKGQLTVQERRTRRERLVPTSQVRSFEEEISAPLQQINL